MGKQLITAAEIRAAAQSGQMTLSAPSDAYIVTPAAKDEADQLGVVLNCEGGACTASGDSAASTFALPSEKVIREVCDLLKARLPAGTPTGKLEKVVRDVVYAKLGESADPKKKTALAAEGSAEGVRFIDHQRLLEGDNAPVAVSEKMLIAEAVGGEADDQLAGGYMIWEKESFTRKVEHPEIAVIVEGELHLDMDGKTLVGKPGDMVYFPKGAVVAYSAPKRVKIACVNCI